MRKLAAAFLLAALTVFALAEAASAQGSRGGRGAAPGDFDFYVLALSWSPGWCTLTGDDRGSAQCRAGTGNAFVLHGLWPQYQRGFPSDCSVASPTRLALDAAKGVYADDGLARHEWQKHGTCSGLDPRSYFAAAAAARAKIVIPPELRKLERDVVLAPIELERAFAEANRGLRPDTMGVACQRGVLEEVRICLSKDLRDFVPCPEVSRKSCRSRQMTIPAVR